MTDYPIALRSDMVKFVKDSYEKEVTEATVGRAIKRMGFTQIIIMRGSRAVRTDIPEEAHRVREIAAEAIQQQMEINAEVKAQHAKEAKVYSGGPRKGTCAWVRLPPGGETGFNPRTPRTASAKKPSEPQQQAQEGQQILESMLDDESMQEPETPPLPIFMQGLGDPVQEYISPYS